MKYTYKNFATDKRHWTRALFLGWTKPTGLLKVPYAIFERPSGVRLLVPEYSLTGETRDTLVTTEGGGA